ncbi:MAG: hypothetical protein P1V97_03045 [Planctomycetota bacterium]|nr:hypothetical protein [Planctomycetota bacterium]
MKHVLTIAIFVMCSFNVDAQDSGPNSSTKEIQAQVKTTLTKLHKVDKKLVASISKDKKDTANRISKYKGMISKEAMAKLKKGDYDKVIAEQFASQKTKKTLVFRFQLMAFGVHHLDLTYKRSKKGQKLRLTLTKVEQFGW